MRHLENDLTGQTYGYLTVLGRAENRKNKVYWHCICRCGKQVQCQTFNLIFGMTRSCGCYRSETLRERNAQNKRNK